MDLTTFNLPLDTLRSLIILISCNTEIAENRLAVLYSLPQSEYTLPEIQIELIQLAERIKTYAELTKFIKLQLGI